MPIGFRIVWTDEDLPTGGTVAVFDDHSDIGALCHRPTFEQDPDGFMVEFERQMGGNVNARSRLLELLLAS